MRDEQRCCPFLAVLGLIPTWRYESMRDVLNILGQHVRGRTDSAKVYIYIYISQSPVAPGVTGDTSSSYTSALGTGLQLASLCACVIAVLEWIPT